MTREAIRLEHDDLARQHVSHKLPTERVYRRAFARQRVPVVQLPDAEWLNAIGVANANNGVVEKQRK